MPCLIPVRENILHDKLTVVVHVVGILDYLFGDLSGHVGVVRVEHAVLLSRAHAAVARLRIRHTVI